MTPAYATPEIFAGMNPDPRYDIYGLACVAYQLLAGGKHPYNKVASPKIKELGIKPKPIKGLNRKQQKPLSKDWQLTEMIASKPSPNLLRVCIRKSHIPGKLCLVPFSSLSLLLASVTNLYLHFLTSSNFMNKSSQLSRGTRHC